MGYETLSETVMKKSDIQNAVDRLQERIKNIPKNRVPFIQNQAFSEYKYEIKNINGVDFLFRYIGNEIEISIDY